MHWPSARLWRILLFFHASFLGGRSRGLDRVVSSETETIEPRPRPLRYETETHKIRSRDRDQDRDETRSRDLHHCQGQRPFSIHIITLIWYQNTTVFVLFVNWFNGSICLRSVCWCVLHGCSYGLQRPLLHKLSPHMSAMPVILCIYIQTKCSWKQMDICLTELKTKVQVYDTVRYNPPFISYFS